MANAPWLGNRKYRITLIYEANIDSQDGLILSTLCIEITFVLEGNK